MMVAIWIGCAVVAYLFGSIPTGYLWGRARGIDIRKVGSGNIGATNVMRILGKGSGITVLIIDALKGFIPVLIAPMIFKEADKSGLQILCSVCVIAGHNWTCWLNFKGGKGVATSAGALLAAIPLPLLCALGAWVITFWLSKYVSLASIAAAVVVPVACWFITHDQAWTITTAVLGLMAIYKHRTNIQRLLAGTENRVGAKKPA